MLDADAPTPRFDDAALNRLRTFGGDKLLRDMIELFRLRAPDRLSAARSALAASDAKQLESTLHSLKSTTAQLGAMYMSRLCLRGESLARAGRLERLEPVLKQLELEFHHVDDWLRASTSDPRST